jgi:hypothetical protein
VKAGGWIILMAFAVAIGCDELEPAVKTQPAPPAIPAPATAPATAPAATQPASSLMNINGHMTIFPAARLRLDSDGQHVVALLYSDDPRDALKDNYTGNSFYLRMVLDIDEPAKLADAQWTYTAPSSSEREDSPYGIFLGGRKIALQPFDVRGMFKVNDEGTMVLVSGQFQILDDTPGRGPAQVLPIAAELPVRVEAETRPAK